jgi:hypothetical protein
LTPTKSHKQDSLVIEQLTHQIFQKKKLIRCHVYCETYNVAIISLSVSRQ